MAWITATLASASAAILARSASCSCSIVFCCCSVWALRRACCATTLASTESVKASEKSMFSTDVLITSMLYLPSSLTSVSVICFERASRLSTRLSAVYFAITLLTTSWMRGCMTVS